MAFPEDDFALPDNTPVIAENRANSVFDDIANALNALSEGAGINVLHFGAIAGINGDAAFAAAANYAISKQNGTGKVPPVFVPPGNWILTAPTPPGIWILAPGAEVPNLPGVPPSYVTDTQYLTGKMIRLSGTDQYELVFVGDTAYTIQKLTGRAYSAALMGASNKAAGGVAGLSYASARHAYDQATIGVIGIGVNDETTLSKPAWAFYGEAWRFAGVPGNSICIETTNYNLGPTYVDNPYIYVDDGPSAPGATYNAWLTSGGVAGCNDASFALGIGRIGTTAAFNKGIMFKTNSVSSSEAVVLPETYQMVWYRAATQARDAYVRSDILRQVSTNAQTQIQHTRQGADTVNGSLIFIEQFAGNVAGVEANLGSMRVFQRANFSGGNAESSIDWAVKDTANNEVRIVLNRTTWRPDADAGATTQLNLGESGFRFGDTFSKQFRPGNGAPIWTSGTGTPQGVVAAPVGSMFTRTDGGASTTLYVKETGAATNTGWVAK